MDYKKIYTEFIADRKAKEPECYKGLSYSQRKALGSLATGQYMEQHHIKPKHNGGFDCDENIVALTPSDHFFAHIVLAKAHGGKMWAAAWSLAGMDQKKNRKRDRMWLVRQRKWIVKLRKRYAEQMLGTGSPSADKTIYTWKNIVTGEVKVCARSELGVSSRAVSKYMTGKAHFASKTWYIAEKMSDEEAKNLFQWLRNGDFHRTEERRKKLSDSHKGKKVSKETAEKIRLWNITHERNLAKGDDHWTRKVDKSVLCGSNNPNFGNKMSAKSRRAISEKNKGKTAHNKGAKMKWITDGFTSKQIKREAEIPDGFTVGRVLNASAGSNHVKARSVINLNTGEMFVSITDAKKKYQNGDINYAIKNNRTAGGYRWAYAS